MATRHSRPTPSGTPGRRTNITGNQYFDVGRVGRKTGITLKDTGIRDSNGLEPLSGIFSSGGSRSSSYSDDGSTGMVGLDSPGLDVTDTLQRRRDPRYSMTRSPVIRRSNAGTSPGRHSSVLQESPATRQLANKRLDFQTERVRDSIEKRSPFKPRHDLRRSGVGELSGRQSLYRESIGGLFSPINSPGSVQQSVQKQRYQRDSSDLFVRGDESDVERSNLQYATRDEIEGALGDAASKLLSASPVTPRKRQQQERSILSQRQVHAVPPLANKRPRFTESEDELSQDEREPTVQPQEQRAPSVPYQDDGDFAMQDADERRSSVQLRSDGPEFVQDDTTVGYDDGQIDNSFASAAGPSSHRQDTAGNAHPPINDYNYGGEDYSDDDNDAGSFGTPGHESQASSVRNSPSPVQVRHKPQPNGKGKGRARASPQKRAKAAPARRQRQKSVSSDEGESGSDDDSAYGAGKKSKANRGARSNVEYRATTPFDDAGNRTTRSGRAVMKPLNWWEGEAVIWKNGEMEGVIRAKSVEPERRVVKKRAQHKKQTKKIREGLTAIDEQGEDQVPSDWEEEVGVMTGEMAPWQSELNRATEEELVTEDIAFASSSIELKEVRSTKANGVETIFNFAKIQTLPFFGSGVVEIPPGGEKSMKNSRRMQMNFFVHKGKVQVTLTTPSSASTSIFSITEGGAWIVPRGNNYVINNHSTSTTASLFFSQGCEVQPDEAEG